MIVADLFDLDPGLGSELCARARITSRSGSANLG
jgi:hypothetical protein